MTPEQQRLVESHMPLARRIARGMRMRAVDDPADLESDAMWGLVKAAERWDPDRGPSFASFASVACRGEILRGRRDRSDMDRKAWDRGERKRLASLNAPCGEDAELGDLLAADTIAPGDQVALREAITTVPDGDIVVLRHVVGLTQRETARRMGRSQMRVCRLERRALGRLRRRLAA